MARKDFTQINTDPVYQTIADATADPDTVQEEKKPRKERRTYTEEEAAEYVDALKTSGRKGLKLPRINLAFRPETYAYVQTMSRVMGYNMTEFVNDALEQHMREHMDEYEKALEFRKILDRRRKLHE